MIHGWNADEYLLKSKERSEIEKAIRLHKRAEDRQRAMAIRLSHLRQKPEAAAEQPIASVPTIYR